MGVKYYFDSFGDSATTQFLASGECVTTGQAQGDYREIKVTKNRSINPAFNNRKFWVDKDVKTDGSEATQLYDGAGTGATGIYVKVYETNPQRTVSITVQDSNEDAVSGASVTIGETTKTTGSAGGCTFGLVTGDYEVTVEKDGYTTATEDLKVDYDLTSLIVTLTSA